MGTTWTKNLVYGIKVLHSSLLIITTLVFLFDPTKMVKFEFPLPLRKFECHLKTIKFSSYKDSFENGRCVLQNFVRLVILLKKYLSGL